MDPVDGWDSTSSVYHNNDTCTTHSPEALAQVLCDIFSDNKLRIFAMLRQSNSIPYVYGTLPLVTRSRHVTNQVRATITFFF